MGLFERIFPTWALNREITLHKLERVRTADISRRNFEAVAGGRIQSGFISMSLDANSVNANDSEKLRNQVRSLEINDGNISGSISRISRNVIGSGIKFQSAVQADDKSKAPPFPTINQSMADRWNYAADREFRAWSKVADKRLICSFAEIQDLCVQAMLRDGEVLVVMRDSNNKMRRVPLCLEVLEIDRLVTPAGLVSDKQVRNGIRYDAEGVPVTYYVLRRHPGDTITYLDGSSLDYEEIPAFAPNGTRKVLHLFRPIRPEQSRGFSEFASALSHIQNLHKYQEAEIVAAREAACLTGIVTTPSPADYVNSMTSSATVSDGSAYREREFSPGQWHVMAPGETVQIFNPTRPTEQYGVFTKEILRSVANAVDIPVETLTQDWAGMNYSNARTVLLQAQDMFREFQGYMIEHLCAPIWESLAHQLVFSGRLQAQGFDRRKDDWLSSRWIPRGWSWVDPVKEATGKQIDVAGGWETVTSICAAQGKDFDDVVEQRARELVKIREVEEKYNVKFTAQQENDGAKQYDSEEVPEDEHTAV